MSDLFTIELLKREDYKSYLLLLNEYRNTDIEMSKEHFDKIYDKINQNSEIWIIKDNEKIIGSTTLIIEQKFIFDCAKLGHIEDVVISANYRNYGLGKKLLNKIIERSKELNCYKVTLVCSESLQKFYEKCEFETRGIHMSHLN